MWVFRLFSCAAVMWIGCWRGGLSCNTGTKECMLLMDDALNKATADERCSGMEDVVACVREDIADCTDNRFTDQYAVNMRNMHCSKAYLCSEKLQACYSKFNGSVRRTIQRSDYNTKMGICRTLLTEIMTCQEEVTSQCQGQTGLMETVSNYQARLNMECNNTDPCISLVLQCQQTNGEEGEGQGEGQGEEGQPPLSDCEAQKPIDYCGVYRKAASCIRTGVAACESHVDVNGTLANLDNSIKDVCDPVATCSQNVSSCLCYINKHSQSPLSILISICTTYPPFEGCLDNLGSECRTHVKVKQEVKGLKDTYSHYHTLYCTSQRGLCPQAVQCLVNLPHGKISSSSSSSSSSDDPDLYSTILHLNTLCSGGSPFFTCLAISSGECQKEAGDVTFPMIKSSFMQLCADIEPHSLTLQECPSFTQCLREFGEMELGIRKSENEHDYVRQMFVGTTTTDFWCSYLTHAAQCLRVTGGAEACAVGDALIAVAIQRHRDLQRLCQATTTTSTPTTSKPTKPTITPRPSKDKNHGTSIFQSGPHGTLLVAVALAVIHSLPALL